MARWQSMTLKCPVCLNEEVTCGVTIIQTRWHGGARMHQCLLCAGAYSVVIVKRFDKELGGSVYMSDLRSNPSYDRNKGWFSGDDISDS